MKKLSQEIRVHLSRKATRGYLPQEFLDFGRGGGKDEAAAGSDQ